MDKKLTYSEWRPKYVSTIIISDEVRKSLKELHIDADKEIEAAMCKEYAFYINDTV